MKKSRLRVDPAKILEWQQRSRSKLAPRSKKTAAKMDKLKPMYHKRFQEHPTCEVPGCWRPSTDPHHHTVLRRKGDGLFKFRCICGTHHHEFHHINPGAAKAAGFLDCLTEEDWGRANGGRDVGLSTP